MSNKSGTSSQIISLPKGGGALQGLGETFAPDLFTGTGNFTVPIALPPGRNGFQPELNLVYSTGNGNGPFGLGWNLSIPGVSRKTSKGVPRYDDTNDVFILSGAEDLAPVAESVDEHQTTNNYHTRYRPRTEGLFARIEHLRIINKQESTVENDYWEVRSKDGLISVYGTERPAGAGSDWQDPAVIADPAKRAKVFAWKLTHTRDPFGNRIEYEYEPDGGKEGPHHWDQLYLRQLRYVDYPTDAGETKFLVSVTFHYEDRPDPFSEYRPGFEMRTRKRCTRIEIRTHTDQDRLVRMYHPIYLDQRDGFEDRLPLNRVSLLSQIKVVGHDGDAVEKLPPLEFGYTQFVPADRDFIPLKGADLPTQSLANPDLELVDLFGNGLPDILEMNGTVRYWRNQGQGRFEMPRPMREAPAGLALAKSGVQLIDANGDGRADLLVINGAQAGYFPLLFGGLWDRRSFQRYRTAPSFNLEDPEVKLIDLDGDGVTDAMRSGSRLECFFNDPQEGWNGTRWVERRSIEDFPNVNFSDPRVKWGDMSGDGLQDIALIYDGNVEYWPNLGYGDWGKRVSMRNSPRFPYGYDPRRILVGDVDGDGLADIVYVDHCKVLLWINQSGNRWSDPIEIDGTPQVSDMDAVRLEDLFGTGIRGVLWSANTGALGPENYFFLDFTGQVKPYLLHEMDNHMGAVTRVEYRSSTHFYVEDAKRPETRWKTPLPFPVQVVARVEVIDALSRGKLTTEYRYHHGYWDGAEREFRGFGRVDQRDTEVFRDYHETGVLGHDRFQPVERRMFSPPVETRTWFHLGPVGEEFGEWQELDIHDEFWKPDAGVNPQLLQRPAEVREFLRNLPRRIRRDALRSLRGSILWTEVYARDGTVLEDRPYTVTESVRGLCAVVDDNANHRLVCNANELPQNWTRDESPRAVFFPHAVAERTTQWERGDDPMTQVVFTSDYDDFGQPRQTTAVALPRRSMKRRPIVGAVVGQLDGDTVNETRVLATHSVMEYASPDQGVYIHDRVTQARQFELVNPPRVLESDPDNVASVLNDQLQAATAVHDQFRQLLEPWAPGQPLPQPLRLFGHTLNHYDGTAFTGRAAGQVGPYGALTRTEMLVFTDDELDAAYGAQRPAYLGGNLPLPPNAPANFPGHLGYRRERDSTTGYHTGYYADTVRHRFDFQEGVSPQRRGVLTATQDPLGHQAGIQPDDYWLFPQRVTNPVGLETTAAYDYRVFQPSLVTDVNGNRALYTFTPLGLLESTAVMGKSGEVIGDSPARPSTRLQYDLGAFQQRQQPVSVRTIQRVHHAHDADVPANERDETTETVEYSDGFGRLLQTRMQAEEVRFGEMVFGHQVLPENQFQPDPRQPGRQDPARQEVVGRRHADPARPNVVVSGWQIYDNKGRVVEKYEPFFATGWDYAAPQNPQRGMKAAFFLDPRGQVLRFLNPDGSERRVIFGVPGMIDSPRLDNLERYEPTPWERYTYDENDLVPLSFSADAPNQHLSDRAPLSHHFTPTSTIIDALGRNLTAIERNGPNAVNEWYITRSVFDIRDNVVRIFDAMGREAFRYTYDLENNPLRNDSIDAGLRLTMRNAVGNEVERRDGKGAILLQTFDVLNRPMRLWARNDVNNPLTLREYVEYGDGGDPNQPVAQRNVNRNTNRLGKLYRYYDEAGLTSAGRYDFKGNVLEKTRRAISDGTILTVFANPGPNWEVGAYRVDWQPPQGMTLQEYANNLLEPTEYQTSLTYDGLNRIRTTLYPLDVDGTRKLLRPRYNRAGALDSIDLDGMTFVEHVAYNARGQRTLIAFGNGVMTRYAYDIRTFRLKRLRSERFITRGNLHYQPSAAPLQDFAYEYDLVGNIVTLHDRTPGSGVSPRPDALDRVFTYDAVYRLLSATGRECDILATRWPWDNPTRCQDLTRTRDYRETYSYDPMGNMTQLRHEHNPDGPNANAFRRVFSHVTQPGQPPDNNRVATMTIGANIYQYAFDANGNQIRENTERHFDWDHSDRMRAFRTQVANSEPSVYAHYLYDSNGQRIKKLIRRQGGIYETTVYIEGVFEHHRLVRLSGVSENNTLHVIDGEARIATVRIGAAFPGDNNPPRQYHLKDHLDSSNVMLDDIAAWINREEYTPYGETSFGSFSRKRYRFGGKERDGESGLHYHGARYYAPWLARWVSSDPVGILDGANLYWFTGNNPVRFTDPQGTQSDDDVSSSVPRGSLDYDPNEIKSNGNINWSSERSKHTTRKNNISKVPREGGVYNEHHHGDIAQAKKTKLNPDIAGEPERMTTVHSRKDPVQKGVVGDKPFDPEGKTLTHHNTAKYIDKVEQGRINPKTGQLVGDTPAGLIDASATSKQRLPATVDEAARRQEQWTRKAKPDVGPPIDLDTGKVRGLTNKAKKYGGGIVTTIISIIFFSYDVYASDLETATSNMVEGIMEPISGGSVGASERTDILLRRMHRGEVSTPREEALGMSLPQDVRSAELKSLAQSRLGYDPF